MQECAVRAEHKALLATADTSRCISVSYSSENWVSGKN